MTSRDSSIIPNDSHWAFNDQVKLRAFQAAWWRATLEQPRKTLSYLTIMHLNGVLRVGVNMTMREPLVKVMEDTTHEIN